MGEGSKPLRRQLFTIAGTLGAVLVGSVALAQDDQSAATPTDVIFARKVLMAVIASNMYEIEGMISSGKIDLARGRANADAISAMIMAFPHLFPPSTNTWLPNVARDPTVDTFADPAIWKSYTFFYKQSQASAKYAYNASRADSEADFKKFTAELRLACDTCHASYQKNN